MKRKMKVLLPALAVAFLAFWACDELLTSEERGKKAAEEICDCMKSKSQSKCEDELNSKYRYYVDDEDFIKSVNSSNTCGITIYKKK